MSPPYPEVTVVNLPSSFMIVISFTPSYSLLAYMCLFLGTVLFITYFFQHTFHLKNVVLEVIRFSHRHNLQVINLEAVTFILTISFRRDTFNKVFFLVTHVTILT